MPGDPTLDKINRLDRATNDTLLRARAALANYTARPTTDSARAALQRLIEYENALEAERGGLAELSQAAHRQHEGIEKFIERQGEAVERPELPGTSLAFIPLQGRAVERVRYPY